MSGLTAVMYHYVRDLARTRYPEIKGLRVDAFEGQLDHLMRHYTIVGLADVVTAIRGGRALPPRACVLTFDDGFLDHFTVVFPRLVARGLTASFFPPAVAVEHERVLDTHKIHFILAAASDPARVVRTILGMVGDFRDVPGVPAPERLYAEYARPSRFDGPEVTFIKRVLQRGLPDAPRSAIVGALFDEYVAVDEAAFAHELYMDVPQLRALIAAGMDVGGHGAEHRWLDSLDRDAQAIEITRTVEFLGRVYKCPPPDWALCYPFGAYNDVTLDLAARAGCAVGFSTRVGIAGDLSRPLELPRLDTNDLPSIAEAAPASWTLAAVGGTGGA
jgi:peptidoglycan/xylan/chitin deacetylase (PgdA/CDA1 family)